MWMTILTQLACDPSTQATEPIAVDEPTPTPATPLPPLTVTPEQPFVDGSRLRGLIATDALGNPFQIGAFDTQTGLICRFERYDGDSWACMPPYVQAWNAQPYSLEPTCDAPRYLPRLFHHDFVAAGPPVPETCASAYVPYRVTDDVVAADAWFEGESCEAVTSTSPELLYQLEPVDDLVMATEEVLLIDGVHVRALRAEDGSELLEGTVTAAGASCSAGGFGNDQLCTPDERPLRLSRYLDPDCTVPAGVAHQDCGPRDLVYEHYPFQAYEAGPEVAAQVVYDQLGGECEPLQVEYAAIYEVGEPVALDLPVHEARYHGAGAEQIWVLGESGAPVVRASRHNTTSFYWGINPCTLVLLDDDRAMCSPRIAFRHDGRFADAACTQPATVFSGGVVAQVREDPGPGHLTLPRVDLMAPGELVDQLFAVDVDGGCEPTSSGVNYRTLVPLEAPEPPWPEFTITGL